VGKDKGATAELCEEYAKRLRRFAEVEWFELKASGPEREGAAILAQVRGELWALDQRGVELDSAQLAEKVGRTAQITLCIGGDEGLDGAVRKAARFTWSLSKLTLPHRIARVVVLEQLYRAFEILRGGPYHK
jgi:23S rRNA (pseudouridine1915-N3)-methyltransferase